MAKIPKATLEFWFMRCAQIFRALEQVMKIQALPLEKTSPFKSSKCVPTDCGVFVREPAQVMTRLQLQHAVVYRNDGRRLSFPPTEHPLTMWIGRVEPRYKSARVQVDCHLRN